MRPELHRRRPPSVRATLPGQLNGVFSTASCSPATVPSGNAGWPTDGLGAGGHSPAVSARAASSAAGRDHRPVGGGSRTDASPGRELGNSSRRVSRLLQIAPEASTATVSRLPTTYTWTKRFSGLHTLLVSARSERLPARPRTTAQRRRGAILALPRKRCARTIGLLGVGT